MVLARWRTTSVILVLASMLTGCAGKREATMPSPPAPSSPTLSLTVGNRSGAAETFRILLDGKTIFDSPVAERSMQPAHRHSVPGGWHKLETQTASGIRHQAMIEMNRDKWVRILREPSKPEGVGVHITEYPIR